MSRLNIKQHQPSERMQWLDSLRAVAALLVIFQHYFYDRYFIGSNNNIYLSPAYEIFRTINFGKMGVVVFFLISGFIIPQSLLQTRALKPIQSFVIARIFRLYPAYWCSVILVAYLSAKLGSFQFFLNLTMIQQFLGSENLLGVYWTLQIELIFYVICAYLFYLKLMAKPLTAMRMCCAFIILALIAASLRYYTAKAIPVAIPLCLAVMFLGDAYFWYQRGNEFITAKKFYLLVFLFMIFLLPICLLAYSRDTGLSERWYAYYLTYGMSLGIFFLLAGKYKIQNRILVYLGLISYSIYLFHPLCAVMHLPNNNFMHIAMNLLGNFMMTVLVATVVYFLVESPGRKIGRKLKASLMMPQQSCDALPATRGGD